ncbi:MAG: D-alanine--D-alanine ligase, partial [Candidatus Omnitrophota bacterium]
KIFAASVIRIEQTPRIIKNLLKAKPDFVFNIAEGINSYRARESQVPSILESLNIPYLGSDPIALGIALDKYLTNIVLKSAGIPVPFAFVVKGEKDLQPCKKFFKKKRLFIVKPCWEGSSKGIFLDSVVCDFRSLESKALYIISKYKQPALIEEFLERDEITAGVCGNKPPYLLGMMRIVPVDKDVKLFLYSQENKRDWQTKIRYEPKCAIDKKIQKFVEEYAIGAFRALELRDIARIDFRLDKFNIPRVIDVNPLPGLSPAYSDLPIICKLENKNYSYLVRRIMVEALKRAMHTAKP